jgi:hypothetical protein
MLEPRRPRAAFRDLGGLTLAATSRHSRMTALREARGNAAVNRHIRRARTSVTMGGGTFSSSTLVSLACGNRRKESVLSSQHGLLGEDARHRALR